MIYSASRRTDLTAFYPDWIVDKIRRARKLDAIVLWTKDPRNLTERADLFLSVTALPTVVQLTITGLAGSVWEPDVPHYAYFEDCLKTLAQALPPHAIQWRFDPILADDTVDERFAAVHAFLVRCGVALDGVTVSFPDPYPAVIKRLAQDTMTLPFLSMQEKKAILTRLHATSKLPLRLCCEPELLTVPGTEQGHCVDGALFDRLYKTHLGDLPRDDGQRKACGCTKSTDIGSYDQLCRHNCRYCYARPERE